MTTEALVDKRIEQAVEWASNSQTSLKKAAAATAQVGDYSGATEQIADRCKRSLTTVYNWANAFKLYKHERTENRAIAHHLWRELPLSFWWIAWDFHNKGYEAMPYLMNAYQHDWKTRDMREEFRRDVEAGNAPLQFKRVKIVMRGLADDLMKFETQLTAEQLEAVQMVRKAFA